MTILCLEGSPMEKRRLSPELLRRYGEWLRAGEKSEGTVEKYLRDAQNFARWLGGREVDRELCAEWREQLLAGGYSPVTVNSMLSALNGLLRCLGWDECRVRYLRIQRRLFRAAERELSRVEYERLVETAHRLGRERAALLLETLCATGIRVSELRYITAEAARCGRAEVRLKGKIRVILLPGKLCRKLLRYAGQHGAVAGPIFRGRGGAALDRRRVWAELKSLCGPAGVEAAKVYPHNLRHLFAATFYKASKDMAKLADVLGHCSIETTRIYLTGSGREHAEQLDRLGLVS